MGASESSDTQAWLAAAGRVPLLTREEEILLGRRIQAAASIDPTTTDLAEQRALRSAAKARERFVAANLRLVYRIAYQNFRSAVPAHGFVDLLQAGAEGLHHAAGKFDPRRGIKFSTYSAWWVRQRIQWYLDWHGRTIRPPSTIARQIRGLPRATQELAVQLERAPTAAELGQRVGLSEEDVTTALTRARAPTSLDRALGDEDGETIGERLWTPEPARDEQLEELQEALAGLPRLQRLAVMAAHLPDPPTLAGFAKGEGISIRRAKHLLELGMAGLEVLRPEPTLQLRLPLPDPVVKITCVKHRRHYRRRAHCGQAEGQLELKLWIHGKTLRRLTVMS